MLVKLTSLSSGTFFKKPYFFHVMLAAEQYFDLSESNLELTGHGYSNENISYSIKISSMATLCLHLSQSSLECCFTGPELNISSNKYCIFPTKLRWWLNIVTGKAIMGCWLNCVEKSHSQICFSMCTWRHYLPGIQEHHKGKCVYWMQCTWGCKVPSYSSLACYTIIHSNWTKWLPPDGSP